ncbi:MAG TPA: beta-ketoacyl-ACP synthase III [Jiangellaceae bacterium]|nr:beta-ketoacyl-ACP synthase III [Jiangellaceae bacterium]
MAGRIQAPRPEHDAAILGLGVYRPSRRIPNAEIVDRLDSSDEWIRQRSGIRARRWAAEDETVIAMSVAAGRDAIKDAGLTGADIDGVIVSTVSHLYQTPSAAAEIAHELGSLGAAFDISAACAGFCYGLAMAADGIRSGSNTNVLVIGVERLSDLTDRDDRSSAFIFADGAGAVVVGPSAEAGVGPVVWGSQGEHLDLIRQRESWFEAMAADDGPRVPHLIMEGNPVFRWASFEMAKVAQRALDVAGVSAEDLDVFIPHQANDRITDALARTLKLPAHIPIARDIVEQGNASAASVPLAMQTMLEEGTAHSGDLALMIGFGAGLVYAAQVARVP